MNSQHHVMTVVARFVIARYKFIVIGSVLLFLLSLLASRNIVTKTQMKDMISSDNPKVKSWNQLIEDFDTVSTILVTVEAPDKVTMIAAAEDLANGFRASEGLKPYISNVNLKVDREFIVNWGLLLQEAKDLRDMHTTFAKLNILPFITALNDNFEKTYTGDEAEEEISTNKDETEAVALLNQLDSFAAQLKTYLEDPDLSHRSEQARELAETFLFGDAYSFDPNYTMLLFSLRPTFPSDDIDKCIKSVTEIRKIMDDVGKRYPDVEFGYGGELAANYDEMNAVSYDLLAPSLVAIVLVLIFLALSFTQIRFVLFAILALIAGIVYDIGLIGMTIKEVNMITSMFGALLVGLGIDFGLHIIANYSDVRAKGYTREAALTYTLEHTGLAVVLGALTTALAFFALALSGYKMFIQLGIVAGCGILTCLFAMLVLLPAMILWFGKQTFAKGPHEILNYGFLATMGRGIQKLRWFVLGVCLLIIIFLGYFIPRSGFEYDMQKIGPQHTVAYQTQAKILERFDLSPFPAMVATDSVEEARRLTDALEDELVVGSVNSISQYLPLPEEQAERLNVLAELHAMPPRYVQREYTPQDLETFAEEIQRLEWNIIEIGDLSVASLGENNKIVKKRNQIIREIFGAEVGRLGKETFQKLITVLNSNPTLYARRLSELDAYFAPAMDDSFTHMTAMTRAIMLQDIPENIINEFADKTQMRFKLTIFPKGNVFQDKASLLRFTSKMDKISDQITGSATIAGILFNDMFTGARNSALIILGVITVLLLLSLRSLKYILLILCSLLAGMVWMFGLFVLVGLKFHFVNLITIPLIIGVGIDYAIHITDRTRMEQSIELALRLSGKAILLSALTTMIGFGSLALMGSFKGVADIGAALFIGIGTCLLNALVLLPALLAIVDRKLLQARENIGPESQTVLAEEL